MAMRWLGLMVGWVACDGFIAPRDPYLDEPDPALEVPAEEPAWRYGIATWSTIDSDCTDGAWTTDEVAMVAIDGDEVTMVFETMPVLTGTLVARSATVSGSQVFMGPSGSDVSCVVDGDAALAGDDAMEGEMHEALSGGIACDSRARYRITFDP